MYTKCEKWILKELQVKTSNDSEAPYRNLGAAIIERAVSDAVGCCIVSGDDAARQGLIRREAFRWLFSKEHGDFDNITCTDWCDILEINHSRLCRYVASKVTDFQNFHEALGPYTAEYADIVGSEAA